MYLRVLLLLLCLIHDDIMRLDLRLDQALNLTLHLSLLLRYSSLLGRLKQTLLLLLHLLCWFDSHHRLHMVHLHLIKASLITTSVRRSLHHLELRRSIRILMLRRFDRRFLHHRYSGSRLSHELGAWFSRCDRKLYLLLLLSLRKTLLSSFIVVPGFSNDVWKNHVSCSFACVSVILSFIFLVNLEHI